MFSAMSQAICNIYNICNICKVRGSTRGVRGQATDLNSFVEFNAEVLKDSETLIQLEGLLVFTKEIYECIPLFAQVQPASL